VALGQVFSEYFCFPCHIHHHPGRNNRPISGRRTKWTVSPHPKKLKKKLPWHLQSRALQKLRGRSGICGQKTISCHLWKGNPDSSVVQSLHIVTCGRGLLNGVWIGYLIYWHHSELHAITALSLIYTLYTTPLQKHYVFQSSLVVSW
jgi:hypothetical protein